VNPSVAFSAVIALLAVYGLILGVILAAAVIRGVAWYKRAHVSAVVLPRIRDALVDYVSGSNDRSRVDELARKHRADFERALLAFQGSLRGTPMDRLCALALDLALVHEWIEGTRSLNVVRRRGCFSRLAFISAYEPCRRVTGEVLLQAISDPDGEVRLAAARALLHSGEPEEVEYVYQMTLSETLLPRVLLSEDLRRHAMLLRERAIPEALHSTDSCRLAAALELLVAWERAIPVGDLRELLEHADPRVRLNAIRLAPWIPNPTGYQDSILAAIEDPDPEIRLAAAEASGRIPLVAAIPALARCLELGSARSARAAAATLAEMFPHGWEALEELSTNPNQAAAAAAREALARVQRKALV
jgi:hypothetical protein